MSAEPGPIQISLRRESGGHLRGLADASTGRRHFLLGAGAVVGAVLVGACGGKEKSNKPAGTQGGGTPTIDDSRLSGDLAIACVAASLENLFVGTYAAGLSAAQAGKLGTVAPAVFTFVQTAMKQHAEHANAWNALLTGAGRIKVTEPNQAVKPMIDQAFGQVRDVAGLARLALNLEDVAAATYLNGLGVLENKQAIKTAASIQPVEMQHAAILSFLLGQYPVPDAFAKTEGARPTTDCAGA